MVYEFLSVLWFILPAYVANMAPVFAKGKISLDFKKKIFGKRILGDGKTVEGSIIGIFAGTVFGVLQSYFQFEPLITLNIAFALSLGAILGDIFGSFIKRMANIPRGHHFFPLDQIDFLLGALIFGSLFYTLDISQYIFLFILTPILHLFVNRIGYIMKLKKVPY